MTTRESPGTVAVRAVVTPQNELLITITNPYEVEPVTDKEGNLITTKPDKRNHGMGLASIMEALPEDIGHVHIKYVDNVFIFALIFSNVI